jgi:hypothetical protein
MTARVFTTMQESLQPESMFPETGVFGTVPTPSESFGTVPHRSESFRSVPNSSASFRTVPNHSERTADHTLTVREVARMFEAAGVSRTERSIVKWCLPNKHDVARLDAFFDANDRKWFITPESVDRAIAEEKARAVRNNEPLPNSSEADVPPPLEPRSRREPAHADNDELADLEAQLRDLEITNRLTNADTERKGYIQQLIDKSHRIGSLETQLLQIAPPKDGSDHALPNGAEANAGR